MNNLTKRVHHLWRIVQVYYTMVFHSQLLVLSCFMLDVLLAIGVYNENIKTWNILKMKGSVKHHRQPKPPMVAKAAYGGLGSKTSRFSPAACLHDIIIILFLCF